jgi:hypothetical protein
VTASYVAAGAATHADNAAVTPGAPAGMAAGDTITIISAIRNVAALALTPPGWTEILDLGHVLVISRDWDGVFALPSCTFSGGIAGDTTSAVAIATRGTKPSSAGVPTSLTNVSAQNIAVPAFTPLRNGSMIITAGWKQAIFTSVATLAFNTEALEASTATGNDQALVVDYVVQAVAGATGSTSFVVTGGVSAVSKGLVFALKAAPAISVIQQDVYPPRTLVTVTGLTVGDDVAIYRVVAGERTLIRAGSTDAAIDVAFLRVDAELPFGIPVSYVVVVGDMEVSTTGVVYTLPGGKVALSDAVSGDAAEVVIGAWPDKRWDRNGSVLNPGSRNVAVLQQVGQFRSEIELVTETDSARENLLQLFRNATNGILQLRAPDVLLYPGVDCFLAVLAFAEARFSQDGTDPRRLWRCTVAQVDGWAAELEATGFTYADLEAAYTGLTYANLAADYATYLLLAQADLS